MAFLTLKKKQGSTEPARILLARGCLVGLGGNFGISLVKALEGNSQGSKGSCLPTKHQTANRIHVMVESFSMR